LSLMASGFRARERCVMPGLPRQRHMTALSVSSGRSASSRRVRFRSDVARASRASDVT